jgi:hypothetical protein
MIPFIGYAPDFDQTLPGVIVDCSAIVPTPRGVEGAPSATNTPAVTLAGQCFGAAVVAKRDDTTRFFAGTTTNLYEEAGGSWTTRTPTGAGQTLNGLGTGDRWVFAQFQDTTLATAKTERPLFLSTATQFAAVTTVAPRCAILETVSNFVIGFDVLDQGALFDSLDRPDGWWCAAKGGFTSWTPSGTTEAATGTLHSTPGKILAAKRFGYQIAAYKRRSMYLGTYVGPPVIWDFQLIPGEVGALSHEAVVNVGTPEQPRHLFMGADNFYSFDGGRPVPIGDAVRETVFNELTMATYYAARALHDQQNKRVHFFYPSTGTNVPDKCVVYHYLTGRWGRDDRSAQAVIDHVATGITYDSLGSSFSTYADLPNLSYDLAFASASKVQPGIFNSSARPQTLTGVTGASSITTGDYGSDQIFTTLARVRPRFFAAPTSATLTNAYRNTLSDAPVNDVARSLASGRFDLLRSARWHRLTLAMTGGHEESGFTVDATPDGEE